MARPSFDTSQGMVPSQGNRELPVTWDFTAAGPGANGVLTEDLYPEMQAGYIDMIQSVFIDNSKNAFQLTVTALDTNMSIVAEPFSQGIYPIISKRCVFSGATFSAMKIQLTFSNTFKGCAVWQPAIPPLTNLPINFATGADNVLVAAIAGQRIKVYSLFFVVGGATNLQFFSGASAGGINLTGLMDFAVNGQLVLPTTGGPVLITGVGQSLVLNSSAAVQVGGQIGFIQN